MNDKADYKRAALSRAYTLLPAKIRSAMTSQFAYGEYFWYDVEKYLDRMSDFEKAMYGIEYTPQKITRKR